ncbi:hypothetical protein [Legionella maioricensis]|uniref:Uncharacterized protein n=1 Tax=Legionella maioricensis TaxID=2896528 RepID=A0A9X2D1T6_9GAMM|nr:hypothetical protein [Legionella maioricensis]MCL9684525.1 hypothetical protein [Legionella maioricensis]MCL9687881.1 hypothetical protein [Legionella maioricensis]
MLTQEEQAAYDEAILENKEDIAVDAILSIIQAGRHSLHLPLPEQDASMDDEESLSENYNSSFGYR